MAFIKMCYISKIIDVGIKWFHLSKGNLYMKSFQLFVHFKTQIVSLVIYLKEIVFKIEIEINTNNFILTYLLQHCLL